MRLLRLGLALLVAMFSWAVLAGSALAADGDRIPSFQVDYELRADGSVRVTENLRYTFGGDSSHGIIRQVITQQGAGTNSDGKNLIRRYPISQVSASSSSGAPADVSTSTDGVNSVIRIGDPDRTVRGTQSYQVRYVLGHVVNAQPDNTVEFHWNVLGGELQVPVDQVRVSLHGPAASTKTDCYRGDFGSSEHCEHTLGATSTFSASDIAPNQGVTVLAAYPASAFTDTSKDLSVGTGAVPEEYERRRGGADPGIFNPDSGGTAALVGGLSVPVIAAAAMGILFHKRGRDERFAGLTPGVVPSQGEQVAIEHGKSGPVAVQFEPPKGVLPGLMGTVIDGDAGTVDVSATIVDLAVRGYLRMEEVRPEGKSSSRHNDWLLTRLNADTSTLLPYERTLFDGIFEDGPAIRLSQLRNVFAPTLRRAQQEMYEQVVGLGWYRRSPQTTRRIFTMIGGAAIVIGAMNFSTAWPLGLGLALAGAIIMLTGRRMAARTALGSAIVAQSLGFRKYLETAEAGQFKFEEAEQIFSRYMPYAVVFGLAKRWATVFGQVAEAAEAAGRPMPLPMWYIAMDPGFGGFGSIADGLDSFETTAAGTFTSTPGSSTPGSIGGSGFSGGGGFSGSGGGGGGVSSW